MVGLLAAMNWPTSLSKLTRDGVGYLPLLTIDQPETLTWLRTHAPKEHATLLATQSLASLPRPVLAASASFWRRAARWKTARRQFPAVLETLTFPATTLKLKLAVPSALLRMVLFAALPKSAKEVAAWLMAVGLASVARGRSATTM